MNRFRTPATAAAGDEGSKMRRIHEAAGREVQSGNIVSFESREFLVSLWLRLLLRTSRTAGLLRLGAAVLLMLAAAATHSLAIFVACLLVAILLLVTNWQSLLPRKAWEDPSVVGVNRLATHSRLGMYRSFEEAARKGPSSNVVSLNGTWKFRLVSGVAKAPMDFETPGFGDNSWEDINVPGHWQLQDAGAVDPPIYTNTAYPFPNRPPYAPRSNPTGLYRRSLMLPPEWFSTDALDNEMDVKPAAPFPGIQTSLNSRLKGRVVVVFQGVDSAFHVWLNGVLVGFAKGSRLPCEFDVTDALRSTGKQYLCVRVVRWSDGSYLEDQDHWWLSGLYRDVELVLRPTPTRISDFIVRPLLDQDAVGNYTKGSVEVEVLVERDIAPSPSSVDDSAGTLNRRRRRGPAAVTEVLGSRSGGSLGLRRIDYRDVGDGDGGDSLSLDIMEEGAVGTIGSYKMDKGGVAAAVVTSGEAVSGGEITCTLIDTATGRRHVVPFAGALPDWQMGLTPSLYRGDVHEVGKGAIGDRGRRRSAYGDVSVKRGAAIPITKKSVLLFRLELPEATRPWSAEDPQLYTLVVGLTRSRGEERGKISQSAQFESARVGFRNVQVASGQLLVNGRAVMLAGVNRHEHDPEYGKTVSEASMRRDIIMMKRFNFNAVRNCHYPNHWRWYELCDELGLYVCDEANIETHGQIPLCRLSADPAWRLAYLDRVWRMVSANKNHACIVLWSLGNESGDGGNLLACRRLVKEMDPSRPVVYEGGGMLVEGCGCTELTDVVCPMYASVERTELLGRDGPSGIGESRPCVLAEYSHAMGNSNGNLHKYWEIFRKHRRLQGGFIWDWADQGLSKRDPVSGRHYWANEGGFSDSPHSQGYECFCLNGLTFPDRSPHPALWEAKFLAQPVGVEILDHPVPLFDPRRRHTTSNSPGGVVMLLLTNRYDFSSLDHLSATWRLRSGADATAALTEPLSLAGIAPGQSREVEIPWRRGSGGERGDLFLDVEVRLGEDNAWAPAGHLVAWGCFEMSGVLPAGAVAAGLAAEAVAVREDGGGVDYPLLAAAAASLSFKEAVGKAGGVGVELANKARLPSQVHSKSEQRQQSEQQLSLIVYEEGDEASLSSSIEGSPMGQLREHLLTDTTVPDPGPSVIVVKGFLDPAGAEVAGQAQEGRKKLHPSTKEWVLAVSKVDGTIQRFVAGGVDLIEPGAGPSVCLWRAATDNDRAGWPSLLNFVIDHRFVSILAKFMPLSRLSHLDRWKASGVCATEPPELETNDVRVERSSAKECVITVASRLRSKRRCHRRSRVLCNVTTDLRVSSSGKLEITTAVEPLRGAFEGCVSFARVGLSMKVPAGCGHVEWLGKGPFECYQDRKSGAKTDVFSGSVEDQHVPYIKPCENGGKADVRWMVLRRGEGGAGILLKAGTGAIFEAASCGLYSAAELQEAGRTVDLPLRSSTVDPVFVNLDHRSMGVGGDNSWYPDVVHEEYRVPANRSYRFSMRLEALSPGDAAPVIASLSVVE